MKKVFLIPIGILLLTSLACSLPSFLGKNNETGSNILFSDDFTSAESGWDQYSTADGVVEYAGGSYHILVTTSEIMLWGNPGQNFQNDTLIAVDITKSSGPDDNAMGIICRYQDVDNFYIFLISSDGYAGIGRYLHNTFTILSGESMESTSAIHQGAATNHVEAACIGSDLTLAVNGTQVASAADDSFSGGDVGLFAKSFGEGGVDILFDNLVVNEP